MQHSDESLDAGDPSAQRTTTRIHTVVIILSAVSVVLAALWYGFARSMVFGATDHLDPVVASIVKSSYRIGACMGALVMTAILMFVVAVRDRRDAIKSSRRNSDPARTPSEP